MKRRTLLQAGAFGIAGVVAGCSGTSKDSTPSPTDSGSGTTLPEPIGKIIAIKLNQTVNVNESAVYPTDNLTQSQITRVLEKAEQSGASGTIQIPNKTTLDQIERVYTKYPAVPDDIDRAGTVFKYNSEYYVLTLARYE